MNIKSKKFLSIEEIKADIISLKEKDSINLTDDEKITLVLFEKILKNTEKRDILKGGSDFESFLKNFFKVQNDMQNIFKYISDKFNQAVDNNIISITGKEKSELSKSEYKVQLRSFIESQLLNSKERYEIIDMHEHFLYKQQRSYEMADYMLERFDVDPFYICPFNVNSSSDEDIKNYKFWLKQLKNREKYISNEKVFEEFNLLLDKILGKSSKHKSIFSFFYNMHSEDKTTLVVTIIALLVLILRYLR